MIVSQQVNNNTNKYILHHAEVPEDDSLVLTHERMYVKLGRVSYSSAQIWITHGKTGIMHTIPFESHVTLSKEEATTDHVKGVDNVERSIVVGDGIHRGRCGCSSCNKWHEPIVYNRRCRRVDKYARVEYLYVELVNWHR